MATETIANGYFYITDGSISTDTITYTGSQKMVKIRAMKLEHDLENPLKPFDMPKTTWGDAVETLFVNLKRVRRTKTVYGTLKDDTGNTKETKRDDLITLWKAGGTVTLAWNTNATGRMTYTVGLHKLKITEDSKEGVDSFPVIATCLVGTDLYVG